MTTVLVMMMGITVQISAQPADLLQESTPDKYAEALELYERGQYGNAQQLFDIVSADELEVNRETRTSAEYYAALSSMKLYNRDARSRVEDFAERYQLSPLRNRLFLQYAHYRFSLKRYDDAAEYYSKVERFHLESEELNEFLFKQAYSKLMAEEYDASRKLFFELKGKESVYSASARYYYAHLLYTDSNYTEALSNFLPLQEDENFGGLVPYYLAQIYYQLGDYDKLLEVGEELIENATPGRAPEIAKLLADAFYSKGDYKNTIKYLEIYRENDGRMRLGDHFQLGYSYYKLGMYRPAIESFNKITAGRDDLLQNAYYHLGDSYLKVGEKKQAISAFSAAAEIKASPTIREDAYFNYAKLVYEISDPYNDAISVLNDFLNEFPGSTHVDEINRYLANLYITTKDYDKAMLAIQRTGLQAPEMQEAYQKVAFYRATEIFNSLKYQAAIKKFEESLKYPINNSVAALSHYWIGEAHYRLDQYNDALEEYEAFRISPGSFNMSEYNRSLYNTGYCYYKLYDFEKAANDFRSFVRNAAKDDPRMPDAYLRLGDAYLVTGGYIIAADFYQLALDVNTREADYALFQKAECLGLAGKREQKIATLDKILNNYPKSTYAEEALFEIGLTNLQLEKYNPALENFRSYISTYPQSPKVPKARMQIGLIYGNTGKSEESLQAYKNVVRDYPGTSESMEAVGLARLIYVRQNRIPEYLDWIDGLEFVDIDESMRDSTAFNAAFDQYSMDSCEAAITGFEHYLSRFPKGIFALRANYYMADCANSLNRLSLSRKAYQNIAGMPRNEYSAEAFENLAEYAWHDKDYNQAKKYYQQLAEVAQNAAKQLKAQAGIMKTAYEMQDYSEAATYAGMVLSSGSADAALALEARQIGARSSMQAEDFEGALDYYNEIIEVNEGEAKADAMYAKAQILYGQGKNKESNDVIYKMIEDLPSFKEYKMKALILLARNFWKQDDIFQAEHTLDFVIKSNFNKATVDEAQLLKQEINLSMAEAEKKREEQRMKNQRPLQLNLNEGLLMIGVEDEEPDTTGIK